MSRAACAQAYIDATPPEVVAQCSRTSIEEVVLDMEAGALMRDAFGVIMIRKLAALSRSIARSAWHSLESVAVADGHREYQPGDLGTGEHFAVAETGCRL